MVQFWHSLALAASLAAASQPFPVQFARSVSGRNVQVSVDGGEIRTTFAGKLGFRDRTRSWASVCADVRSPIRAGQAFRVRAGRTAKVGGNVAKAGNIVARWFDSATTADQCAGLQLAVWEAVEDGGAQPDFANGRFRAMAGRAAMTYAAHYYEAIQQPGEAVFLDTGNAGGQNQISTVM